MARTRFKRFKKQVAWTFRLTLSGGLPAALWLAGAPAAVPVSVAALGTLLLLVPRACRATNKDGTLCGNNANGLLGACHLQAHKYQNGWRILPLRWRPRTVRPDLVVTRVRSLSAYGAAPVPPPDPGLWGSPSAMVMTLGSLGRAAAVIVSIGAWLFPQ